MQFEKSVGLVDILVMDLVDCMFLEMGCEFG
jgi:hypothetical protein